MIVQMTVQMKGQRLRRDHRSDAAHPSATWPQQENRASELLLRKQV